MPIRYSLLLLFVLWTSSLSAQVRKKSSYHVTHQTTGQLEYGYLLHTQKTKDKQTTLRLYYPFGDPWINPKYTIRYNDQGQGTWQESSGDPCPARMSCILANERWLIVCDTVSYIIYREKKHRR